MSEIKVVLNGVTIVDVDVVAAGTPVPADGKKHPGIHNTRGHLGFLGHGDVVAYRNMRVKPLD